MNIVNIIGNLTKDPEIRYTTGENPTAICRFGLANNEGYGENKRTNFLNIVVFGKQAENCEKFLKKGSKVAITGRIQTGSYERVDRKVYTTDIVANSVEFLSGSGEKPAEEWKDLDNPPNGFAQLEQDEIPF